MARSVTGLFMDQRHVDPIVGALIDAGFGAERISVVSPDDQAAGGATPADQRTARGRGASAWLVAHHLQRGLSHEHAQRYQEHVAQGGPLGERDRDHGCGRRGGAQPQRGFVAYGLIKSGDAAVISLSIWNTAEQAAAAAHIAAAEQEHFAAMIEAVDDYVGDLAFFWELAAIGR